MQRTILLIAGLTAALAFAVGVVQLAGVMRAEEQRKQIELLEREPGRQSSQDVHPSYRDGEDTGEGANADNVRDDAPEPRRPPGRPPVADAEGGPKLDAGLELDFNKQLTYAELNIESIQFPDEDIRSGAPFDAIPALDHPRRHRAADINGLSDDARVAVFINADTAVAYPIPILNYHEVINDTVGDTPVAVTYCPLCDSAAVFDRRIAITRDDGETQEHTLTFGVSGLLANSNVLLYDDTFKELWSQVLMECISGDLAGTPLRTLPVEMMRFDRFRTRYPDGEVTSLQTGHRRNYQRNPYDEYLDDEDSLMSPVRSIDDRLPLKTPGVGIVDRETDRAIFVPAGAIEARGGAVTIEMSQGPVAVAAGESGVSIREKPASVDALQTFWYAWSAFYPQTEVAFSDR